jgi:hypothetical protein
MTSLSVVPEFPFSSTNTSSYVGDYPIAWSESVDHAQPSTLGDPLLRIVSTVSSGLSKVTHFSTLKGFHPSDHFDDLPSGGITFPDVDITSATVVPSPDIYLQDFLNNFDEPDKVSIQHLLIVNRQNQPTDVVAPQRAYSPSRESTPCRS